MVVNNVEDVGDGGEGDGCDGGDRMFFVLGI